MQRHDGLGRREIQLGEDDAIGRLDLGTRLLVPGELPRAGLGVDRADDARRHGRRRVAQPLEPVEDGPGLGDAGRLQHHHLRARATRHLGDGGPQLGLHAHLVADAAADQLQHVAGAALDEAGVDVDPPELVDDHPDAPAVLRAQHAVQDGGLSRPQEPGEQDERWLDDDFGGHGARL